MTLHNMVLAFMAFSMKLFCVQGQVADITHTEAKAGAAFGLSGLLMWYHQPTVLRVVDGDSIKYAPYAPGANSQTKGCHATQPRPHT